MTMNNCPAGVVGNCGLNPQAPATPDAVTPDITFSRVAFMDGSQVINGVTVRTFGYNDGNMGAGMGGVFPAPLIRVKQGQIVHTVFNTMDAPHTIHHHGIEPSTFNDGVGHYSFDVLGNYTYQWYASHAGTYMYHCHVNTVLHVEMGMYGALIIDPPTGPGKASDGTPYDVEAVWAPDDIDTSWHCLPWNAALCGGDARLNDFNPDLFCINGLGADLVQTDPRVAISVTKGQTLLLRYIMASYLPHQLTFDPGLGSVTVVAEDGRVLATPETLTAGSSVLMTTAERYEFIIKPTVSGTFPINITFYDYRTASGTLRKVGSIGSVVTVS